VMWSVVERTALAEAEIEYADYESDTIWVKFPVLGGAHEGAKVVIWTTTPWTIPANRAISFSNRIEYGLYEITGAPEENWAKVGEKLIIADKLVGEVMAKSKVDAYEKIATVTAEELSAMTCAHPLRGFGGGY